MGLATTLAMPAASADQPSSQTQQDQSQQSMKMAKRMSGTATVVKVDHAKRHLTLRDEQGKEFSLQVPDTVKRFDEIQQGDRIKVDYYESAAISLKKSEAGAQPSGGETTMIERNAGKLPSGAIAHRVTGTVEVVNVDKANNRVTVRKPNGDMDTIDVTDPSTQSELGNIKAGDRVQVTYTEAAAINVTREGKGAEKPQGTYQNEQEQQQQQPGMGGEKGTSGQKGTSGEKGTSGQQPSTR